jgi:hypothetical protein
LMTLDGTVMVVRFEQLKNAVIPDSGDTVADLGVGQACAERKCSISDIGNASRYNNTCQAEAKIKG